MITPTVDCALKGDRLFQSQPYRFHAIGVYRSNSMRPVRLGFIGLGQIPSIAHLPALEPLVERGEVLFQAFCDVDASLLKKQVDTYRPENAYSNHREMLDKEELDAVYLCVPPTLHTDELLISVGKGLAGFVEKPQSLEMAKAVDYNRAVQKAGVLSQVGFVNRYEPAAEVARELLAGRTIRHLLNQEINPGKPLRYWTSRYALGGGSFVENTIHRVDLLRYLTGTNYTAVSAFYVGRKADEGPEPMNLPHVYNVNYRFNSGITANTTTSRVMYGSGRTQRRLLIVSDDSLIEWSSTKVIENGQTVWESEGHDNAFALQAQAFVAAVQSGDASKTLSPYGDALNSLAAALGANLSAEQGGELVRVADLISGRINYQVPPSDEAEVPSFL